MMTGVFASQKNLDWVGGQLCMHIPKYAFSLEIDFVYIAFSFLSIEGWVLEYHSQ
jgi:hypothetical protein